MDRVVLIRPKNVYGLNNYPSLGLLNIATVLAHSKIEVDYINVAMHGRNAVNRIFDAIRPKTFDSAMPPVLIGLTMTTAECPDAYYTLNLIRHITHVPIVVGGWHVTLFGQQMIKSNLCDYVVEGYGEEAILDCVKEAKAGNHGPILYQGYKVDPNNLLMTNYKADPNIEYYITSPLTDICYGKNKIKRWLPYESSRGCPSRCAFCVNVVTGNRHWLAKDSDTVGLQMPFIAHYYNLDHIKIVDDNFFVDCERVGDIAAQLASQDVRFTWDAECRCDYFNEKMINDNLLKLCKRTGLVQLTLGVESGDDGSLKMMKKDLTTEQAEHAIAKCDEYGIFARASFIVGLPGEPRDAIERTNRFINKLRKYKHFSCGVQTFRPYPRCELTAGLVRAGHWKEPEKFSDWRRPENVGIFTAAQKKLSWQLDPEYAEAVSSYQSIQSGISLPDHMVSRPCDRDKLAVIRKIAGFRNRHNFYRFQLDRKIHDRIQRKYSNA